MVTARLPESLAAVLRRAMAESLGGAALRQQQVLHDSSSFDTFSYRTRERFTAEEVAALLRAASPIAHPHGRGDRDVAAVVVHEAPANHGWPSYRAAAMAPTDGDVGLGVSWRLTVPHRDSVILEIDNLWLQPAAQAVTLPDALPERVPLTTGYVGIEVGLGSTIHPMEDGRFSAAQIDDALVERVYTEGGPELLSPQELGFVERVIDALVTEDRAPLEAIGAYSHDGDPLVWTRDYGRWGTVHLVRPPGTPLEWPIDVMQVDTSPGWSMLVVTMWTREEGASDLSLELNIRTDAANGEVSGEFCGLHVM